MLKLDHNYQPEILHEKQPTLYPSKMEWVRELDRALDLYNAHDDTGCIAYVNSVLRDTTPGYPRTRYYALLACCLDDWREADVSFLHTYSDL